MEVNFKTGSPLNPHNCQLSTVTVIKLTALVIGLLLAGAGVALYCSHVNVMATCIVGGLGLAVLLGVAHCIVRDCLFSEETTQENTGLSSPATPH